MSAASEQLRTHQEQLDADGIMVGVSRQAVDETLAQYNALRNALKVLLNEATSFSVSGVYFDEPCMNHKGPALAQAALDQSQ